MDKHGHLRPDHRRRRHKLQCQLVILLADEALGEKEIERVKEPGRVSDESAELDNGRWVHPDLLQATIRLK